MPTQPYSISLFEPHNPGSLTGGFKRIIYTCKTPSGQSPYKSSNRVKCLESGKLGGLTVHDVQKHCNVSSETDRTDNERAHFCSNNVKALKGSWKSMQRGLTTAEPISGHSRGCHKGPTANRLDPNSDQVL